MWSRLSPEMVWGELAPRCSQKAAFVSVPHHTQNIVFSARLKQLASSKAGATLDDFFSGDVQSGPYCKCVCAAPTQSGPGPLLIGPSGLSYGSWKV